MEYLILYIHRLIYTHIYMYISAKRSSMRHGVSSAASRPWTTMDCMDN